MKRLMFLLMLLLCLSLSSCTTSVAPDNIGQGNNNNRFVVTEDYYVIGGSNWYVTFDTQEKLVCLYFTGGSYWGPSMNYLYKADGQIMTIDEYKSSK